MQLNHYSGELLQHVTDLINRPPRDADELVRRWIDAGMGQPERPATAHDLAVARRYLARWVELVDADTEERRITLLNALLAEYTAHPRITAHDSDGWHIHFRDDGVGLGAVLGAATSAATAQYLTDHGIHRLGRCELAECRNVYVDQSRGGRQRYCSRTCANRDAVRRHRANRAAKSGARR